LQQHHADQRDNQNKMNDNNDRQHSRMSVLTLHRGCERLIATLTAAI
jgi:hypothetical protein